MKILQRFLKGDIRSNKLSKEIAREAIDKPEILNEVAECLSHEEKVVRAGAAGTFAEVTDVNPGLGIPYVNELINALNLKESQTRWEAIHALGNIGTVAPKEVQGAIEKIRENVKDKSVCVKGYAVIALGQIGGADSELARVVFPYLEVAMKLFEGSNDTGCVIGALGRIGRAEPKLRTKTEQIIRPFLDDKSPAVRKRA